MPEYEYPRAAVPPLSLEAAGDEHLAPDLETRFFYPVEDVRLREWVDGYKAWFRDVRRNSDRQNAYPLRSSCRPII